MASKFIVICSLIAMVSAKAICAPPPSANSASARMFGGPYDGRPSFSGPQGSIHPANGIQGGFMPHVPPSQQAGMNNGNPNPWMQMPPQGQPMNGQLAFGPMPMGVVPLGFPPMGYPYPPMEQLPYPGAQFPQAGPPFPHPGQQGAPGASRPQNGPQYRA